MMNLEVFQSQYEVDRLPLVVQGRAFSFFVPKTLDRFLNRNDIFQGFPLWAKIWEASLVLADYLASRRPVPGERVLEIGAGLGVVGVVASAFGHDVVMTEHSEDALNFAAANAMANSLNRDGKIEVMALDWHCPHLAGTFSLIVGSETVYSKRDFAPLASLFDRYLAEGGEVILAEGLRTTTMEFLKIMSSTHKVVAQKKILRSQEREIPLLLASIRSK